MSKTMKQLADISLFQSLEQGNVSNRKHVVFDPFASTRDVSVQNVDLTLSMVAQGIQPNPTLQKLLGILKQLGSLGLAEKTLQGFQATSIKSVIDALIYGIGDTNILRKAGINVGEKTDKPAEPTQQATEAPAPATQEATTPKEPEAPKQAPTKTKEQKIEAAPIKEQSQSSGDIEKEYWKQHAAYVKAIEAYDKGKMSKEEALPIMRAYKEIKDKRDQLAK